MSLRGAVSDEAISVFGQRLLRCARNDTSTFCHAVRVLSHSPKAFTALFEVGAKEFYNYIKDRQEFPIRLSHFSRATVVGGGLPIMVDGEIIGGIGVGDGTEEQDIDCAKAGLKVLERQ